MTDIFQKRVSLKPHEYPELAEYANSIRHSYWLHTEFNYTSDINDFLARISPFEKQVISRAMLAIAQIEVNVKTFWGDIYKKMPKPEIGAVGYTFAESEVRHADAYSHLIELLNLNHEFAALTEVPVIKERIKYLTSVTESAKTEDLSEYAKSVLLFSLFIENVSLFSQFLIIMSFNKHKNTFKGISNAVEATSKEEQVHALFGIEIINIIQKEHPEWFTDEYRAQVLQLCREAYDAEAKVVDWIYEGDDLPFLPKEVVLEFIKVRFNKSLQAVKMPLAFDIDETLASESDWFDIEVLTTKHTDFFHKRSVNYNKKSASVTAHDLF
jgi:ribonucleoside-diphosphate reductase beta chain